MFNLTLALVSSSRRKGGSFLPKLLSIFQGRDFSGKALCNKAHAVVHPGAAPLTDLGIALIIETTLIDGKPPVSCGLYFPYRVPDSSSHSSTSGVRGGAGSQAVMVEIYHPASFELSLLS